MYIVYNDQLQIKLMTKIISVETLISCPWCHNFWDTLFYSFCGINLKMKCVTELGTWHDVIMSKKIGDPPSYALLRWRKFSVNFPGFDWSVPLLMNNQWLKNRQLTHTSEWETGQFSINEGDDQTRLLTPCKLYSPSLFVW